MVALKDAAGGTGGVRELPRGATRRTVKSKGEHSNSRGGYRTRTAGGSKGDANRQPRSNSSSAANKMSKAQRKGYAKAYASKPKPAMRSAQRRPGFDPFDAIGNLGRGLGDAVKNAFGEAVPQDIMFRSITDRIRDVTKR